MLTLGADVLDAGLRRWVVATPPARDGWGRLTLTPEGRRELRLWVETLRGRKAPAELRQERLPW